MPNFLSQINALASINLNQTELIKAQVENQPDNAGAGTGVEGHLRLLIVFQVPHKDIYPQ
jgi:hypothetical protein